MLFLPGSMFAWKIQLEGGYNVGPEPWPLTLSRVAMQLFTAQGDKTNICPYGEGAGTWPILILETCLVPGEPGRVIQGIPELDFWPCC